MDRRKFLQLSMGAAAIAALPAVILEPEIEKWVWPISSGWKQQLVGNGVADDTDALQRILDGHIDGFTFPFPWVSDNYRIEHYPGMPKYINVFGGRFRLTDTLTFRENCLVTFHGPIFRIDFDTSYQRPGLHVYSEQEFPVAINAYVDGSSRPDNPGPAVLIGNRKQRVDNWPRYVGGASFYTGRRDVGSFEPTNCVRDWMNDRNYRTLKFA